MITSVRFCLSNDLLNAILSPSKFVFLNDGIIADIINGMFLLGAIFDL